LIVALLAIDGLTVSSAAASSGPETRVRAYDTPSEISVGQRSGETAGRVGCLRPAQPAMAVGSCVATNNDEPEKGPVTPARAKELAEAMGYVKTNFRSHGQAVYKKGKSYISRDVDGHCGGVWKEASSPEDLASKSTRNGTYNADLTERVGD
jgi:hypothetical protein